MTQRRIWNYGDTFTSERASTQLSALHAPGVYVGYDISIDSVDVDVFYMSPGFLLLPSGILVGESVSITTRILPLPSLATDYTIVIRHTNADVIGGQTAVYSLELGLLTQDSITNGIPIAYIRHPGGAVALDMSFIYQVRKITDSASDSPYLVPTALVAPFSPKWVQLSIGANTSVTDSYVAPNFFTKVETDALAPSAETTTVVLPMVSGALRPVSVVVRAVIDATSSMILTMKDTDGNAVILTGGTLAPGATFYDRTVSVDPSSGVFTTGDIYTLEIEFNTPALESVDLQSLTINYDPLP